MNSLIEPKIFTILCHHQSLQDLEMNKNRQQKKFQLKKQHRISQKSTTMKIVEVAASLVNALSKWTMAPSSKSRISLRVTTLELKTVKLPKLSALSNLKLKRVSLNFAKSVILQSLLTIQSKLKAPGSIHHPFLLASKQNATLFTISLSKATTSPSSTKFRSS